MQPGSLHTFSDCAMTSTGGGHVTEVYIYVKVPKADSDMNKLQELKPKACYCTMYSPNPRIGNIGGRPTAIEVSGFLIMRPCTLAIEAKFNENTVNFLRLFAGI